MRFQDPIECTCESCGRCSAQRTSELLRLTATCPACDASFRDVGESMRALTDDAATFYYAVRIIMQIEEDQGIEIPDSAIEERGAWERLTIRDLIAVTDRCFRAQKMRGADSERVVEAAIMKQFPSSLERLDYDAPLLGALSPGGELDYGASYE